MSLKKTATVETAHATFAAGEWKWYVLKTYKAPKGEGKDPYARWFCAVSSPHTYGGVELGDTYVSEVRQYGRLIACSPEWTEAYGEAP